MKPAIDIEALADAVQRPREAPLRFGEHAALEESWREPAAFRSALLATYRDGAPLLKSHPSHGFDFFHDLVLRHAAGRAPALLTWDPRRGETTLGYGELHDRALRLAAAWMRAGAEPGACACLVAPLGPEYLVALCAALRIGLTLCALPPQGARYLRRRLGALAPDLLLTTPALLPQLRGLCEAQVLLTDHDDPSAPAARGAFSYPPDAPVLRLFSPLRAGAPAPTDLPAEIAFGAALRDGLLLLGLQPGGRLVSLGLHAQQHQPLLLLTSLLLGATYVPIEVADLEREPTLLANLRPQALVAAPEAAAVLPRAGVDLRAWHLSLGTGADWPRGTEDGLRGVPVAPILYEAAGGGCLLFSSRQKRAPVPALLPAPGVSLEVMEPNALQQAAPGPAGLLTSELFPEGHAVVARAAEALVLGDAPGLRRRGRVYPADEATAAIAALPFVDGAAVVGTPGGARGERTVITLLVFLAEEQGPPPPAAAREELLRATLRLALGDEHLPDVVTLLPLPPRRRGGPTGPIDEDWVRLRHQSGALSYMAQRPAFRALAALRRRCLRLSGVGPADRGGA